MSKTAVISCRVDEEMLAVLDRIAAAHDRSRSWIVHKLLTEAARTELKLVENIEEGVAAIEAGDYCTHEEFMDRLDALLDEDRRAA